MSVLLLALGSKFTSLIGLKLPVKLSGLGKVGVSLFDLLFHEAVVQLTLDFVALSPELAHLMRFVAVYEQFHDFLTLRVLLE